MSKLRTVLSAMVLIISGMLGMPALCQTTQRAQADLTLSGSVGVQQLIETVRLHPEAETLDLSGAVLEGNRIPAGLFAGSKIKAVVFPTSGRLVIGDGAFMGTAITKLELPPSVVTVGDGAFAACPALKEVKIHGAEIKNYAFQQCPALEKVELEGVTAIGAHAFEGCGALTEMNLGNALQTIGDHALAHTALTSFRGNKGLKRIGAWALAFNRNLTSVSFPDGVTLGEGVLFACPSIAELQMPASLGSIPAFAFTGSSGLGEHRVPEGVDSIGALAYKDTDIANITLPSSITHIGSYAMENATQLTAIDAAGAQSVPTLGTDVWAGVNQGLVVLKVPEELRDRFRSSLQWQDFNIEVSGLEDAEVAGNSVRMAIDHDNLIIEASRPMTRIEIYDESGTCFVSDTAASTLISIPTANLPRPLILVRCTLDDGTVATAKLLR